MRDLLVTLIVLSAIPMALTRPFIGIYLFAWISYMNPHRLTWGFAYDMPFAAIAAAATLLGLVFGSKHVARLPMSRVVVTLILFYVWINVTTLFALTPEAMYEWERTSKIIIMALVTGLLIQSRAKTITLVWVIALSICFFGVKGGIFTLVNGGVSRIYGPPGTFFEDNNDLALALMMALPLLFFLYRQVENVWIKYGLLLSMPLCIISVLSSYSRGGFVTLAATGAFVAFRSKYKVPLVVLFLVSGITAVSMMPEQYTDRLSSLENVEEDSSAMGRINSWWFAFNLAKDRPVVGGGFEVFRDAEIFRKYAPEPEDHHDAHSIYFEVLGEHGFIGLGIFLFLLLFTMLEGYRIRAQTKNNASLSWAYDLAGALQVSLFAYAIGGAFLGLAYFDFYYHIVIIMAVTAELVKKEVATEHVVRDPLKPMISAG